MTSPTARTLIAGNWKMNGISDALSEIELLAMHEFVKGNTDIDIALCVPTTLLGRAAEVAKGSVVKIGGQDCHAKVSGAHTGDVSAQMLADCGATYVIVGHSERRTDHGETDMQVADKVEAAMSANLIPIVCVGETKSEREDGRALDVVSQQIAYSVPASVIEGEFVIAYEPVWAIGTGLVPTIDDITDVHDAIRTQLIERFGPKGQAVSILYGGSMKPSNAAEILRVGNVNGGLVGGASLKSADFSAIIAAA